MHSSFVLESCLNDTNAGRSQSKLTNIAVSTLCDPFLPPRLKLTAAVARFVDVCMIAALSAPVYALVLILLHEAKQAQLVHTK